MRQGQPLNVYFNATEDPLREIALLRLEAVGVDHKRVVLDEEPMELPADLGRLEQIIKEMPKAHDLRPDVVVLDPLIGHFKNPYHGHQQNKIAMNGLIALAKRFDLAIVLSHHFKKGLKSAGTVEAAIGGMGAIQNIPKAVYIFGPHTAPAQSGELAFASEKFNFGVPPSSLLFHLETWKGEVKGVEYEAGRMDYMGPIDAKAADIFDACKRDERGTKQRGVDIAADFIREAFADSPHHAMDNINVRLLRSPELEEEAQREGVWYSKGTWDRARTQAGVESLTVAAVRKIMGPNWSGLDVGKGWVALTVPEEPDDDEEDA